MKRMRCDVRHTVAFAGGCLSEHLPLLLSPATSRTTPAGGEQRRVD
jgi:hypothetical protein